MQEFIIKVEGMSCSHCENRVKKALLGVSGVTEASVDLAGKTASAKAEDGVSLKALTDAITDVGFDVVS